MLWSETGAEKGEKMYHTADQNLSCDKSGKRLEILKKKHKVIEIQQKGLHT